MINSQTPISGKKAQNDDKPGIATPTISVPKGGGAIRGIGEKFGANPVTGTGSLSVAIATSPGRSGFGPQLSLSYDSGSANGPFGFGWSLSLPSITRKTDKGLPQYNDASESDVFILSGAEDLVPVLMPNGTRHDDDTTVADYTIRRYRPRIEGLFARIERWTRKSDGDVHWRSISKDNVLTLYGSDANSRIQNPAEATRIFKWLVCETRDDKGNAVLYDYKSEDGSGIDLGRVSERNRGDGDDAKRKTNRYLKGIRYGNRTPLLSNAGHRPRFLADLPEEQLRSTCWMFEVIFDYGEHDANAPKPNEAGLWTYRDDPFSSYRSGFEVRTTRLCRRVLMFHHIPDLATGEKGYEGLVRSTDFQYSHQQDSTNPRNPIYTFLSAVTQSAWRRSADGYDQGSLPPVEFEYTRPIVQDMVEDIDPASLENLPIGVDGASYQWTDLHGEGIPGILAEQAGAWFYKRNISPIGGPPVEFAALEFVPSKPSLALAGGQAQFMDLAGDGLPDLVVLDGPMPGLYEHDEDESWQPFRSFSSRLNRNLRDPNLKFVDLDGDGHTDVLITEDYAFVWHPSLAEAGFGPARRVAKTLDEEKGPRLAFADGAQSIYLADFSGDGLTDLVRIRNGEVCFWPNLGYGRFGAKVTMDDAPTFDNPDQFDHKRIRLADIDGSGTTDIIYLHRDGVRLYFNQSGNSWGKAHQLNVFPRVDDLVSIATADLLGNGTACLVWSSPLPGDIRRPMRYVNLMGGQKPHLLVKAINNLGAETVVRYAPSTKFYLQDKRDGNPWITRLPFPVHVVERVETHDRVSRNCFVTRYAYHHGYFDGEEREFRGFGMVEQWDTEDFAALTGEGPSPGATNMDATSNVPPVLTRTWFHTGVFLGRDHVSDCFAGLLDAEDKGEYYREPGVTDAQARALLLPDTVLPSGLTPDEEREACRALKGSMLRQEIYALDGTPKQEHPYTVEEQNFTVRLEQLQGGNRHAVFFTHASEAITYHYERNPADPRVQHALTLEVDPYGNVLKQAAIGYGRRQPDLLLPLQADRDNQTRTLITYTENRVTNQIDDDEAFRNPLPCEARTFELTGYLPTGSTGRFQQSDFVEPDPDVEGRLRHIFLQESAYEETATGETRRRPIEWARTLYRKDDLTELLPLGELTYLGLLGENYKLAFTPGLLAQVFQRNGQSLLPNPAAVLGGEGPDRGGYLPSQQLKADGRFPKTDADDDWWIPSGRALLSPKSDDTAAQELVYAQSHFFLPQRYRDPFHTNAVSTESFVTYDAHDLLMIETRDALDNRVTVGERRTDGTIDPGKPANDYRVLQPLQVMDPNRNRVQAAFDVLGIVVGTALMGKPEESFGDSLADFAADLSEAVILDHLANPLADPHAILGRASTRLVYDVFSYFRTRTDPEPQPAAVYTMVRETHDADQSLGEKTKVQHAFSYSDGFGREIQKKIQAESEKVNGAIGPPRWVGSGWTIFNNKGKPVRQYEPFFSTTHRFEVDVQVGVSPILFYDPVERVVATLHPNHTYTKVVFDPWRQVTWDVNDTVMGDPRTDDEIGGYTAAIFASLPASNPASWQTWYAQRQGGALGAQQQVAAGKAAAHADTPATAHFDTLGRPFLTLADKGPDPSSPGQHLLFATRAELDIEGNQRVVRDAIVQAGDPQGRIVMRYDYDMLGHRIHQSSMGAGQRWMLNDVAGKPIRGWDSRDHSFRTEHDELRRPLRSYVIGADVQNPAREIRFEERVYGESAGSGLTPAQVLHSNLRGRLYKHFDTAGVVTSEAHDFKGNVLHGSRQLLQDYKATPDWSRNPQPTLETEIFASSSRYDALNRPIQMIAPRSNQANHKINVIRPGYNEANLLERVDVWVGQTSEPSALLDPASANLHAVINIDYDAKGQRSHIEYGNGSLTEYSYDSQTFRLIRLKTIGTGTAVYQDLSYTYDPIGNITHIGDDAQQTIYFNGQVVLPQCDYTYDSLYRLISATGREHMGQLAEPQTTWNDEFRVNLPHPGDGQKMRNYTEQYVYDAAGNFETLVHQAGNGSWTRTYAYNETSLIENGAGGVQVKTSNRLSNTKVGTSKPISERYAYDAHGNMTGMPHLTLMQWDFKDQLSVTSRQVVNAIPPPDNVPETTFYVYDAGGQRVRKVMEGQNGARKAEQVYLGAFDLHRELAAGGNGISLERETLHIMDDKRRIALLETKTLGEDASPSRLIRYQLGNHLGSATLELDERGSTISYEEYFPHGSTSYEAVDKSIKAAAKRYRYTSKERDDETGLSNHERRYYASWIAKWISSDPEDLIDGINTYTYARNNPIIFVDRTGSQSHNTQKDSSGFRSFAVDFVLTFLNEFSRSRALAKAQDQEERADVARAFGLSPADYHQAAADRLNKGAASVPPPPDTPGGKAAEVAVVIAPFVIAAAGLALKTSNTPRQNPKEGHEPSAGQVAGKATPALAKSAAATTAVAPPQTAPAPAPTAVSPPSAPTVVQPAAPTLDQVSTLRGNWDLDRRDRGRVLESTAKLPGTKINGNFSDFDRAVYGAGGSDTPALEVGQTKSIDTTSPGYVKNPRSIYTTLNKRIGEVAGIGEGVWEESGHKVVVGPQTRRVFDVILPPEPLTPAQSAQLNQLAKDAAGIGVEVRQHVMH